MTALPSQPERQAEGLRHRSRGQHARVCPRKITSLEASRPERALQPLMSHRSQKTPSFRRIPATLKTLFSSTKSRVSRPKSRVDLACEPLIQFENTPKTCCLPNLRHFFCPTMAKDSGLSNRFQTVSGRKIMNLCSSACLPKPLSCVALAKKDWRRRACPPKPWRRRVFICALPCNETTVPSLPKAIEGYPSLLKGKIKNNFLCLWRFWPPPASGLWHPSSDFGSLSQPMSAYVKLCQPPPRGGPPLGERLQSFSTTKQVAILSY